MVEEKTSELTHTKEELEALNRSLQERVDNSIADLRKKDQLMIIQGRQAAMGEMIGAIAHQWRQPLNSLGLVIQNLKDAHVYGELDTPYLEQSVKKCMMLIGHMSKTIDDFRNFFHPHKEKTLFNPVDSIKKIVALFSAQLMANDIEVQTICSKQGAPFSLDDEITHCSVQLINGFQNEFEHVLINLLNNGREAILARRASGHEVAEERGLIKIKVQCGSEMFQVEMSDNGCGIPDEIRDRIFDPYFTTKDPATGTGLGLYMSKVIIEEHMHGTLRAVTQLDGSAFVINLPRATEGNANG